MNLIQIAKNAAEEAQLISLDYRNNSKVLSSDYKDIKTEADLEMNKCIIQHLKSTNIPIISEETEIIGDLNAFRYWVIDPLDGTFNFSRRFPFSGVSISLLENMIPVLGVVKDIFTNSTYTCDFNNGSYKDGLMIKVSEVSEIKEAILATGFPSGANYQTKDINVFVRNVQLFKKVRAVGSAALMLSYVSAGIFDVYYENDIYLWDVAAGLALVEGAGGRIYYRQNSGMKYEVLASNKNIFDQVKSLLIVDRKN